MRIVNKTRFITSIAILFLIILESVCTTNAKADNYIIEDYQVVEGKTLWQIAEENKEEGTDTRKYIHEIKNLNNLRDCNIIAGQTIKIKKGQ